MLQNRSYSNGYFLNLSHIHVFVAYCLHRLVYYIKYINFTYENR